MLRPQCSKDFELRFIKAWPVMVQPKKDGVRCMVNNHWSSTDDALDDTEWCVSGWAKPRDKKPLVEHKPHIQKMLRDVITPQTIQQVGMLDGEIFRDGDVTVKVTKKMAKYDPKLVVGEMHTAPMHFEDICSGIKATNEGYHEHLQYHIFDNMDPNKPFKDRYEHLEWWYNRQAALVPGFSDFIKLVPCKIAHNMEELTAIMDAWSATDEGVIVRDPNEHYVFDSRTRGCMRWKYFKDAEYPVYDIVDGIGKNVGIATFKCYNPEIGGPDCKKAQFSPDSTGKREQRMKYFTDREKIIGSEVTVTYQNISKYGIPRFPKVKCVRDYE